MATTMERFQKESIDYIINALSDHDLTQKFGDPRDLYKESYEDLDILKEIILTDVKVDINKNIRYQKDIFPKALKKSLEKVLPARTSIDDIGSVTFNVNTSDGINTISANFILQLFVSIVISLSPL